MRLLTVPKKFCVCYNILKGTIANIKNVLLYKNRIKEELIMIIISLQSIYYFLCIISILCGVSYKLGYENGKYTKK